MKLYKYSFLKPYSWFFELVKSTNIKIKKPLINIICYIFFISLLDILTLVIIPNLINIFSNNSSNFLFSVTFLKFNNNLNLFLILIFFIFSYTFRIYFIKKILQYSYNTGLVIDKVLMNKIIFQNYDEFRKNNSNFYTSMISKVQFIVNNIIIATLESAGAVINLIFITLFLIYINFYITISVIFLFIFVIILINLFLRNKIRTNSEKINIKHFTFLKTLNESFKSYKEIYLSGTQEKLIDNFSKIDNSYKNDLEFNNFLLRLPRLIIELSVYIILIILFLLNQKIVFISGDSFPLLVVFIFATLRIMPLVNIIYTNYNNICSAESQKNEIIKQIKLNSTFETNNDYYDFYKHKFNKVELKNISYSYGDTFIIKNFNYNFNSNDNVFISGFSGSGKSTFLDIFSGIIPAKSGNYIFDGKCIDVYNNPQWKKIISYVQQFNFFFDDTLFNNITYWDDKTSENIKRFLTCLSNVQMMDFYNDNFCNLDLQIGESAIKLSGGQRQRLGIARALYKKNTRIILLDEATNSLDEDTEKNIINNIINNYKEKLILFVTHNSKLKNYFNRSIYFE